MRTSISIRHRLSLGLSEAAIRRLQAGVWLIALVLAIAMNVVMLPELVNNALELADMDLSPAEQVTFRQHVESLGISVHTLTVIGVVGSAVQETILVGISAVLLRKRNGTDWFAWYLCLTMVAGIGAIYPPDLYDLVDGRLFWLGVGRVLTALSVTSLFLIPFLFPTGRFVPWWMIFPAALMTYGVASFVFMPGEDASGGMPPALEIASNLLLLAAMLGSIVYRYRRKSTIVQQQQMKWGAAGAAVALPTFLLGDALMRAIDGSFVGVLSMIGWSIAMPIANLVFPVCLTVAILRYRLWEIDIYLSRTLVWILMTVLVIATYVAIVFGIDALITGNHTTLLSLVALGLTAVLFEPVRHRVQQGINRLLFGERDDPYQVVRQLAADLSETVQPVEALRATVRTLTESLRLPYAAITLETGTQPVATAGSPGVTEVPIPLVYQTQPVGELIVSPRGGARAFDATDLRLLDDLSCQIGVVAHNVRLTNDLQLSRERLVTAREEERRRLRRDLHDGLGAQLAALNLQAGAMKATIHTDPDAAVQQAAELQQELRNAIADIRRLVQGLRPAALDDLGLIGALQNRIGTVNLLEWEPAPGPPLRVELDAPEDLGPLPAAVEVAIYRIVDEALTNVVVHAQAQWCTIRIARHPAGIRLTVEDDGVGISADRISGVGLQSMRERALELGGTFVVEPGESGGTRIVADLPVSGEAT
ncbi:MAG: sensor histidine kinase [Thermomicrobiales bacterium]